MTKRIRIDPAERRIIVDGRTVKLRAKSFDLLALLASRPGHLFPRSVLLDRVWQGRSVSPDVLAGCIRDIRRALGAPARDGIVQTVPGCGYRLTEPLDLVRPATARRPGGGTPRDRGPGGERARPSIAVLRFASEAEDSETAIALSRDIALGLSRTRWIDVAASASVEVLEDRVSTSLAAERLGVRYVLDGRFLRDGPRVLVAAALSDGRTGRLLWADRFHAGGQELRTLMEAVCLPVVASVESEIESEERRRAALSPIRSLDAWVGFHRGMGLLQSYEPSAHGAAAAALHDAARADPSCARVAAATSWLHWQQAFLGAAARDADAIGRASTAARDAVSLDPDDPLAHWAMGRANWLQGDLDAATEALQRARGLNPSSAPVRYALGYSLCMQGKLSEALTETRQAIRLSPLDPLMFTYDALAADLHWFTGAPGHARSHALRAASHPNVHAFGVVVAAWVLELCGDRPAADACLKRLASRWPGYDRRAYFAALPCQYGTEKRRIIEGALDRLGA